MGTNAFTKLPPSGKIAAVLIGLGLCWLVFDAVARDSGMAHTGEAFFAALERGEPEAAYATLSAQRRGAMTLAEFTTLTDHPAFRESERAYLGPMESYSDGMCSLGGLYVDGQEWGVQIYFIEDGDRYAVHSFAIQPPATVQLGTLLEECGYWEGTRMGYSGPEIERSTQPTD